MPKGSRFKAKAAKRPRTSDVESDNNSDNNMNQTVTTERTTEAGTSNANVTHNNATSYIPSGNGPAAPSFRPGDFITMLEGPDNFDIFRKSMLTYATMVIGYN